MHRCGQRPRVADRCQQVGRRSQQLASGGETGRRGRDGSRGRRRTRPRPRRLRSARARQRVIARGGGSEVATARRSTSPNRSSAVTSWPSANASSGEHAGADGDDQDLHRSSDPGSLWSAASSVAATMSAVAPGLSRCPSARSRGIELGGAGASRRGPGRAAGRDGGRRLDPRLSRDQRVWMGPRAGRRAPPRSRPAWRRRRRSAAVSSGRPFAEDDRVATRVLRRDQVAPGGGDHRLAQRHPRRRPHVVLDASPSPPGSRQDDRLERRRRVARQSCGERLAGRAWRSDSVGRRPWPVARASGANSSTIPRFVLAAASLRRRAHPVCDQLADTRGGGRDWSANTGPERERGTDQVAVGHVRRSHARRDAPGFVRRRFQQTRELYVT